MAEMSVVSLNVNGLRDHRKRRLLFDFLKYEKFDVIFLQETHIATVEDCVKWNNNPRNSPRHSAIADANAEAS